MVYRELILSDEKRYHSRRHLLFWIFYVCYFYFQSIGPKAYGDIFRGSTYTNAILNLVCFSPVSIVIILLFRKQVMNLIIEKRYLAFVGLFIGIFLAGSFINYFAAWAYLSIADYTLAIPNQFQKRMEIASWNTRWAMVLGVVVTGLQLARQWYLQTTENLGMIKVNAKAETRIQKSRIHPEWLFASLGKIESSLHADAAGKKDAGVINSDKQVAGQLRITKSAEMILHLSDILSYSLYESDADLIPLAREMEEIEQLVLLEQKNESGVSYIEFTIDGQVEDKLIAPMSVINRVIDHITAIPGRKDSPCTLGLHFKIQETRLEMFSEIRCNGTFQTENIEWILFSEAAAVDRLTGLKRVLESKDTIRG